MGHLVGMIYRWSVGFDFWVFSPFPFLKKKKRNVEVVFSEQPQYRNDRDDEYDEYDSKHIICMSKTEENSDLTPRSIEEEEVVISNENAIEENTLQLWL